MNLYALYASWAATLTPGEFALYVILPFAATVAVVGTLLERRKS